MKRLLVLFFLILFPSAIALGEARGWEGVEKVFGRKGTTIEDVFKITFPRFDLKVQMGKVIIEPGLALTSWIGFEPMGNGSVITGDLILLEREVTPVVSKLTTNGIEITAIHNHLIGEIPHIIAVHFSGQGNPVDLAQKMKQAIALTKTPLLEPPLKRIFPSVDWTKVEAILGQKGKHKGNLLQLSIPRVEVITENGMSIPPSMGAANSINFQMIGSQVATTGDVVLLASEVNPVIKTFLDHGIAVTAVHNHMLSESPRFFMLHFWGFGDSVKMATGLRAVLDKTNAAKSAGGTSDK